MYTFHISPPPLCRRIALSCGTHTEKMHLWMHYTPRLHGCCTTWSLWSVADLLLGSCPLLKRLLSFTFHNVLCANVLNFVKMQELATGPFSLGKRGRSMGVLQRNTGRVKKMQIRSVRMGQRNRPSYKPVVIFTSAWLFKCQWQLVARGMGVQLQLLSIFSLLHTVPQAS